MVKAVVSVMVAAALFGSVYCGDLGLQLGLGHSLGPYNLQLGGHGLGGYEAVGVGGHELGGYAVAGGHDGYLDNSLLGGYSGGHGIGGYTIQQHHHVIPAAHTSGLSLDAGYDLGHLSHGHALPVVKKVVTPVHHVKKPIATYHDFDTQAFLTAEKPYHHHHHDGYHGGTDFDIVPSISYGYSYKLIPTDSFGYHHSAPVHHSHDHGHGSGFGLDVGLSLGDGHHHHH